MESSQEANAEVMREMTRKLYSQYEERLHEEQQRHSAEREALLVCYVLPADGIAESLGCIVVGELYMVGFVLRGELVDSNVGDGSRNLLFADSLLSLLPPFLYSPPSLLGIVLSHHFL